jgi:hypothetical protein
MSMTTTELFERLNAKFGGFAPMSKDEIGEGVDMHTIIKAVIDELVAEGMLVFVEEPSDG